MEWLKQTRSWLVFLVTFVSFVSLVWCFAGASPSLAQEISAQDARTLAEFRWKKDESTGNELAASRSDSSFNYFDIGDLSYYSELLVEQDFRRVAAAAGLTIERTPAKSSTVEIFHDTKAFSRLRDDKPTFNSLGLPNNVLEALEKQVTDTSRCASMTVTDDKNNIVNTIVLISEKSDGCLISGVLNSFGIAASDISAGTLIDVCILYEGRRRGLRDRQNLAQEISKLREICTTKAGEIK